MPKQVLKQEDINLLLNIDEKDITSSFLMNLFGEFDGKSKLDPWDILTVPSNKYVVDGKPNKKPFTTTVGIWLYNILFFKNDLTHIVGYINENINKKLYMNINEKLSYALIEDKITLEQLKKYLMKTQFLTPMVSILSSNHTEKMMLSTKKIDKRKQELLKKYSKEIEAGDEIAVNTIEKELLTYAREILKDDPSMDIYESGAMGSFDNNFKNMYIMRGAAKDPDPNKGYNIITSNYINGVKKDEFVSLANSLAAGPYARSKKTELGGYMEKQFISAFQHIITLPRDSDCGTKRTIEMKLDDNNLKSMMYSYIVEGSRLIELNSSNMEQYRGKTVKFRFSSLCESEGGICNKCIGNLPYYLDKKHIGVETTIIPSKLKVSSMKSFHDSSMKFTEIDVNKAFGF